MRKPRGKRRKRARIDGGCYVTTNFKKKGEEDPQSPEHADESATATSSSGAT